MPPTHASSWQIVYPPPDHTTSSESIFFVGTAPPTFEVRINQQPIHRSPAGHFAPRFPLMFGSNAFTFELISATGTTEQFTRQVIRQNLIRTVPTTPAILTDTIQPQAEIWRWPEDLVCFEVIGTPQATVDVQLWDQRIPLTPVSETRILPSSKSMLTDSIEARSHVQPGLYQGCARLPLSLAGQTTVPQIHLTSQGETLTAPTGKLRILDPDTPLVVRSITDAAVIRTGPSYDFIRLSPWPQGVQATVTGREDDWIRTRTHKWIAASQAEILAVPQPPHSLIRGAELTRSGEWSELRIPLSQRLPYTVTEEPGRIHLDIDQASLQTDFLQLDPTDPLVKTVTWMQLDPDRVRFTLHLSQEYAWGYEAIYQDTILVLRIRHAPAIEGSDPFQGLKIAIDPGHGGSQDLGALGPNGYPEKALNLVVGLLVRDRLQQQGAEVWLTRSDDRFVSLVDRAQLQEREHPHLFLSLHYNALPDDGDPESTHGIGSFWYHPHSRPLAQALHTDLIQALGQPDYGHYFASLAVIRPTHCPSVLLELGFMIHPEEFELITRPDHQDQTAAAIVGSLSRFLAGLGS